jgi:hypothetical protein
MAGLGEVGPFAWLATNTDPYEILVCGIVPNCSYATLFCCTYRFPSLRSRPESARRPRQPQTARQRNSGPPGECRRSSDLYLRWIKLGVHETGCQTFRRIRQTSRFALRRANLGVVRRQPRDWKAGGQRYARFGLNPLALVNGDGAPGGRRHEPRFEHTAAFDQGREGPDRWLRCVAQRRGGQLALHGGLFLLYASVNTVHRSSRIV